METQQQGAVGKSGLWLLGEAQSPGDACGSGARRGTGGKFLVHGTLGLCTLLRGLQHPPAASPQPRCEPGVDFMNVKQAACTE